MDNTELQSKLDFLSCSIDDINRLLNRVIERGQIDVSPTLQEQLSSTEAMNAWIDSDESLTDEEKEEMKSLPLSTFQVPDGIDAVVEEIADDSAESGDESDDGQSVTPSDDYESHFATLLDYIKNNIGNYNDKTKTDLSNIVSNIVTAARSNLDYAQRSVQEANGVEMLGPTSTQYLPVDPDASDDAKALADWIKDPENSSGKNKKFKTIPGAFKFARMRFNGNYCLSLQGKKANNFYHIDEKYFTASSGPNFTAIAANDIHILTQKYTPNKENGDPAKRNHTILLDIPYGTGKTEEVYKVTKNEEVLLGTAKTKKYFGVYSSYVHLGGSATAPLIIGRTEYDFSKKKYTNNVLDVNLRSAGYKKILKNKDNTKASLAAIEKNPNAQGIIFTFHGIGCLLDGAIMRGHINCVHGANVSTINGGSYH